MKTRLLILIFVLVLIPIQLIYAPPVPNPKGAFDYAEYVVVGKILSVKILSEPDVQIYENIGSIRAGIALYEIQVEEYLKNPMDVKIIIVPGYYIDQVDPHSGFNLLYKVNQRVLLYIQADYPNALVDYDLIINDNESRVLDGHVCDLGTSYHEGTCVKNNIDESMTVQNFINPEPEPKHNVVNEQNLDKAMQNLRQSFDENVSFGPFNMKDVVIGYGISTGSIIVDVKTEYYESENLEIIKENIQEIAGDVHVKYASSEEITDEDICGKGFVLVNGMCQSIISHDVSVFSNNGFITFLIILVVAIPVSIGLVYWRKRK